MTLPIVEGVARALCDLERPVGTYDRLDEQGRMLWQGDAATALRTSHHKALWAALEHLVRLERSIKIDVGSAHKARETVAAEITREVDAGFRLELEAAFADARSVLAKVEAIGRANQ